MIVPRRRLITVSTVVLCSSAQYHMVEKRVGVRYWEVWGLVIRDWWLWRKARSDTIKSV